MVKGMVSEREPWHASHRKSRHNLVKLFGAAVLLGFSFHLLFCHNPELHVSEAPITIERVETNVGIVEEKRDSDCLPVPETPVEPKKTDAHLVLVDGNGGSITFLPLSEVSVTSQRAQTQLFLIEGNHTTAFFPVSEIPVTLQTDTQVEVEKGHRSTSSLPVSEAIVAPPKVEAQGNFVDEKQDRDQKGTQVELEEGNRSTSSVPVSEATVAPPKVEAQVNFVDEKQDRDQKGTQVELEEGDRSTSSVPVSEATVAPPKVQAQDNFVDEKQDGAQKDTQVELEEGNRSTSSVPASEATVAPPNVEAQANFVDEKQERENAERRNHNNVIRRWRETRKHCNVYKGQWVYDKSYPFYNVSSCPFNRREFDCLKYGRLDTSYLKFRWKPDDCELPRFNALDFLWRLRGKRIMFVGDSLTVNNWVSLVCMLHAAVPPGTASGSRKGRLSIARFEEYDVEVINQWQPYLVDIVEEDVGKVLRLNSLENNGTEWSGADLLIFNSWYWWWRQGAARPFDYFHDGEKLLKEMNRLRAFAHALNTWGNWVNSSVDTSKTTIVYQGVTPSHLSGRDWGQPRRANCHGQKHPVKGSKYPIGLLPPQPIVKDVLNRISKPVHLLDITQLSQLRKDGHPGMYNGLNHLDCGHWCVGGLPDTWNQLLYAALV